VDLKAIVTGSTVLFVWEPPASGDSVTTYMLEAGSSTAASNLASFSAGDATMYRANVPLGTYYVRVRAVNAAGAGPASDDIAVRVADATPCAGPPAMPQDFGGFFDVIRGATSIELSTYALGPANSFIVEIGSASGRTDLWTYEKAASENRLALMLYGTVPRGSYFVRVRARNACGIGEPSNEVVIRIQ
jgi:hypothetical protein